MSKDTEEKILRAAVGEFAEHGYQAATVRNIVERAGAKNLNAVVYYFGNKQELYKAVLEFMFLEAAKFKEESDTAVPDALEVKEKIAGMIRFLCRAYYCVDTRLDKDLYEIFIKEAGNPSPFFAAMVSRHLKPGRDYLCSLLREYLGPRVPDTVIDDCEYSITAQILYGALGWSIIQGTAPERKPFGEDVESFANHVVRFSLAALAAIKEQEGA